MSVPKILLNYLSGGAGKVSREKKEERVSSFAISRKEYFRIVSHRKAGEFPIPNR